MLRILSVSIPISVMFVTNNHTIEIDFYLKLSFKINLLFTDTVYFRLFLEFVIKTGLSRISISLLQNPYKY